jgi:uncharacterized protein
LVRMAGAPVRVVVLGLLNGYRAVISPLVGERCRFHPSCSAYAMEAVRTHGVAKGVVLGAWRLLRCHPFSGGGPDPVPERGRWTSRQATRPLYDNVIQEI